MEKTKSKKETPVKSPSVKDKANSVDKVKKCSEKKNGDQNVKKFAIISPDSILMSSESIGIPELSEDVVAGLAEEVSYRLREVVHKCSVLVNNNKRRKLLTEDVNRVLETSHSPAVFGHSVAHGLDFTYIPEADIFVEDDNEVDIVTMSSIITAFTKHGQEYVKGTWLLPDPIEKHDPSKDVKEEPGTSKSDTATPGPGPSTTPQAAPKDQQFLTKPPPHFTNYYLQVARVVIGGSEPHLRVALADLRTNSKIGPLVPYFLNLVALSVNKLQRNGRLTDALLRTVEALVDNPYVDPSSQLAVYRAVNALLVVAIEPKAAKNCDDLLLRKRAAQLLSKVLVSWSIELKQQMDIVRQLVQLLLDGSISLRSHYGAIVSLTSLGLRTLQSYFWPILDRYVTVLENQKTSPADASDVQFVKGAIMIAVERMYRRKLNPAAGEEDMKRRQKVEQRLNDFLGDALVPRYNLRSSGGSVYPAMGENTEHQPLMSEVDLHLRESLLTACTSQSLFPYQPEVRGTMPKLHMYSVFSLSHYAFRQPKEIVFNFIGSNQLSSALLKRRRIGESLQKEFKSNHYRFAQFWRLQKTMKKTCTIKYRARSHLKSSVGDLFVFI